MNKLRLKQTRFSVWYVALALFAVWGLRSCVLDPLAEKKQEVSYDQFRSDLAKDRIQTVTIGERITYTTKDGEDGEEEVHNTVPTDDPKLVETLLERGVEFQAEPATDSSGSGLFGWLLPLLPLILIWWFLMRRMGKGGAGGILSVGKSKAVEISGEMSKINFSDVGGVEEVEVELKEIIDFLKDPSAFTKLGAKLPKGVLLWAPPVRGRRCSRRRRPERPAFPSSPSAVPSSWRCSWAWAPPACATCSRRPRPRYLKQRTQMARALIAQTCALNEIEPSSLHGNSSFNFSFRSWRASLARLTQYFGAGPVPSANGRQ